MPSNFMVVDGYGDFSANNGVHVSKGAVEKPTVRYHPWGPVVVGRSAAIIPLDHPEKRNVDNGQLAHTSRVLSYDEVSGDFETLNTRYVRDTSCLH